MARWAGKTILSRAVFQGVALRWMTDWAFGPNGGLQPGEAGWEAAELVFSPLLHPSSFHLHPFSLERSLWPASSATSGARAAIRWRCAARRALVSLMERSPCGGMREKTGFYTYITYSNRKNSKSTRRFSIANGLKRPGPSTRLRRQMGVNAHPVSVGNQPPFLPTLAPR